MKNLRKIILKHLLLITIIIGTTLAGTGCSTNSSAEKTSDSVSVSQTDKQSVQASGIPDHDLTVHFIDIGQGDSTLITCNGKSMLIDAGENDKGTAVQSYLQKQGIKTLDYVIGTHPHSDHIGGLDVIINKFNCGTIILPDVTANTATYRDVISAMNYKNYKNTLPVVGASYTLGDASFTIIAPNRSYGDETNNWSVGIILSHGSKKFLFTGDAEEDAEADIVNNGINISCDVYQVGHHGSNTSSSDLLLDKANPSYAVISCGEGNSYGHPRAQTLNNFRARGIKVFRTDEQGTIVATSDGTNITWNASPSETWQAGEPVGSSSQNNSTVSTAASKGTTEATTKGTAEETVKETTKETVKETVKETTYVLNTKSKKFHRITCNSLPTSNRKDVTESRDQLISEGYDPCGRCNP